MILARRQKVKPLQSKCVVLECPSHSCTRCLDLLTKDFNYDQKFTVSSKTLSGVVGHCLHLQFIETSETIILTNKIFSLDFSTIGREEGGHF